MTIEKMIGGYTRREWLTYLGIATADDPKLAGIASLSFTGNALKVLRVNATENGWEFASATSYSDEQAQDAVGGILTDTATVDFTYNDGANTITADVKDGSITLAKQANVATATVFYRKTAGTGAPEVQTLATLKTDLGLSGTNTGDQTSVSGNAGTATALQTSRNIDGQAFNGTADITVIAPGTHAATSKATPVDADELPLVDSAASNVLKKLTWANLKAALKTYLDGFYQPLLTSAWTPYTPTVTVGSGSITTLGTVTGRYKQIGKTYLFEVAIPILTNGTAGTSVSATLPNSATTAAEFVVMGMEANSTGALCRGYMASGASTVQIKKYDNTYPGGDGTRLVVSGVFEAA